MEVENNDANILLTGQTGSGKTSLINLLFNEEIELGGIFSDTSTFKERVYEMKRNKKKINIIDTPGFGDIGHDNVTDDFIINGFKKYKNIKCVLCCLSSNERFPKTFTLNICEMLHLYDVQLSNFCFVFTKIDICPDKEKYVLKIKNQMFSTFGWVKLIFVGKNYLDDIKEILDEVINMPTFSQIPEYLSTSMLDQFIKTSIDRQKQLMNIVSVEIGNQTIISTYNNKIKELDTVVKKESLKGYFSRNDKIIEINNQVIVSLQQDLNKIENGTTFKNRI